MILRSKKNSNYFFISSRTLLTLAFKKFYKFTEINFTSFPAEANPPGKWGLVASKFMKVSEK
jgi:hypothetical protein